MTNAQQTGTMLYSAMAFLHFLLACFNPNEPAIFLSQLLAAAFWLYMIKYDLFAKAA
jgi:hypothetical protein